MTEYNEGLFDGMLATFTLGYIDAEQFWELLTDQHFSDADANLTNIHLTDWCELDKKQELIAACWDKKAVEEFLDAWDIYVIEEDA